MIDRRMFISSLVGGLLTSRSADAQTVRKVHRIGYLSITSTANGLHNPEALRAGLSTFGYVEGRNITVEARWADGRIERLPQLAVELARLPVDVLCTAGGQASGAAQQATSTIPIVFANVAFPVQSGLVASYPHPGGNTTGVAFIGPEYGKRLELLKEAYPKLDRVALIYNPDNPGSVLALQETQRWTTALGVRLEPHEFRSPDDFERLFGKIAGNRPDALRRLRRETPSALHVPDQGVRAQRRSHVLRWQHPGDVPAGRRLRGQDPQGRQTR